VCSLPGKMKLQRTSSFNSGMTLETNKYVTRLLYRVCAFIRLPGTRGAKS
jgi:hypothetical protein